MKRHVGSYGRLFHRLIVVVIVIVISGRHIVWFFPTDKHQSVGKRVGKLAEIERWQNTVCQRLSCYVGKSLSFSKLLYWHELVTR